MALAWRHRRIILGGILAGNMVPGTERIRSASWRRRFDGWFAFGLIVVAAGQVALAVEVIATGLRLSPTPSLDE